MANGYKTYVVAVLIALAAIAKYFQVLDSNTADTLLMLLGATGTATIAAKVNRVDKKLMVIFFLLLFPSVAFAQAGSVVTKGPVDTSMKINWENPSNITLTDAPTFEYRLRDSYFAGTVTIVANVQCVAGTPVTCTAPLTQALADALNKVGTHNLTLSLFRADVGESFQSLPFGLPSGPPTAPTNLKIIRTALLSIFSPVSKPLAALSHKWGAGR